MEINKLQLLGIGLIIALLMGYSAYITYESADCINSPFNYGIKALNTLENGGAYCSCFFKNPKYKGFSFDEDGLINSNPLTIP